MAPMMSVQKLPSELICHCTVGVGIPLADALKVAMSPGGYCLIHRMGEDYGRGIRGCNNKQGRFSGR